MKRLAVFASMLLCTMAPQIRAEEQCSNADLRGVYSFVASGTFGSASFVTAGQTTYHGDGQVDGLIQISLNGTAMKVTSWAGKYTVDPATCTANKTADIPGVGTVHFFVTAGDGFRELRFIATDAGASISGTARKQ
jgi:hypothetical protein